MNRGGSTDLFWETGERPHGREAALLASLPKAPSLYSPFKNPEKARERRSTVLKMMLHNKFITEHSIRRLRRNRCL